MKTMKFRIFKFGKAKKAGNSGNSENSENSEYSGNSEHSENSENSGAGETPAPSEEPAPSEPTAVLSEKISINAVLACIWRNKWKYVLPLVLTGAVVSWLALSIPRYYKVTVMLAPEYNVPVSAGGFSGLASSLGINVGATTGTDAIIPTFYPDLISSTDFLVPLFNVKITTKDGRFKGTYAEYLKTQQKNPWWTVEMNKLMNKMTTLYAEYGANQI